MFNLKEKGYKILSVVGMLLCVKCLPVLEEFRDVNDVCSARNNYHVYNLEETTSFQLILQSSAPSDDNNKLMLRKIKRKCTLVLKACPSCHFIISISNMQIPSCSGNCSCNKFEISEPLGDYKSAEFCGIHNDTWYYLSLTRTINLDFVQSVHKKFYVSLTINVSRNVFIFTEDLSNNPKYIETPFFPHGYPPDYGAEYIFQAHYHTGVIQLLFLDYQLSKESTVEISGLNSTHTDVFDGNDFRPPAIVSSGSVLKIRFQGNDQPSNRGFRAQYWFIRNPTEHNLEMPQTGCGGVKDGFSGVINVTIHIENLYDCIWLIHPPLFAPKSLFLSMSVLGFSEIGEGSVIEFREGQTSKSKLLKVHHCDNAYNCSALIMKLEILTSAEFGLYIRFHGHLSSMSRITLAYYVFSENDCSHDEFRCQNSRCIKNILLCDGISQCTNGADERECSDPVHKKLTLHDETKVLSTSKQPITYEKEKTVSYIVIACGIATVLCFISCIIKFFWRYFKSCCPYIYFMTSNETSVPVALRNNIFQETDLSSSSETRFHVFRENLDVPPSYTEVLGNDWDFPPLLYSRQINLQLQQIHENFMHKSHETSISVSAKSTVRVSSSDSSKLNFPVRNSSLTSQNVFNLDSLSLNLKYKTTNSCSFFSRYHSLPAHLDRYNVV